MNIIGWILVGTISSGSGSTSAPNYGLHATAESCLTLKKEIEEVAPFSKVRCVQVTLRATK